MIGKIKQLTREWDNYHSFFSLDSTQRRLVFYSERDIYYQYYEGYLNYIIDNSNLDICYLTSDGTDPIFNINIPRIKPFFIDILLPMTIRRLDAKVLVMTMPDLNKYHIKRSRNNVNHVYMFHAFGSIHLQYRKEAFSEYDTIMCPGPHNYRELRREEELYNLHPRDLIKCGYYRIEKIYNDYRKLIATKNSDHSSGEKIILIAPSWHSGNILEYCIEELVDVLNHMDYRVIIRPHPEYVKRNKSKINKLRKAINFFDKISLELNMVNKISLLNADVLLTDWSLIGFEYAFGTEKPVLFVNTPPKITNPDYSDFGIEPIEQKLRNKIGMAINFSDINKLPQILHEFSVNNVLFKKNIIKYRMEYLYNWKYSSEAGGEYLINACME